MQFVFGWVKKMVKGSKQYKELMAKNPPTQYQVAYATTSGFSLGQMINWWQDYAYLYKDGPYYDTYTVMFKQASKKSYQDYAPVKANDNFSLDSKEGYMAIGSLMYYYAHRPSIKMCD